MEQYEKSALSHRINQQHYDIITNTYKHITIFISSTFKEFEQERDYIIENLPKRLEKWGEVYGLDFDYVDLRWGISVNDSASKRTIPLCLKAVENSVPFVIAMIGDRRGWIPQKSELPKEIIELIDSESAMSEGAYSDAIRKSIDYLRGCIGKKSITEIEIAHALMHNYPQNVLFLIKDGIDGKDSDNAGLIKLANDFDGKRYSETNKKGDMRYTIDKHSLVEYIFNYIVSQLVVDSKNVEINERFRKQCFIYGKYVNNYVYRKNELDVIRKLFHYDEGGANDLIIEGASGTGRRSVLAIFIKYLIEHFFVDVIFSFDELSMDDLRYQMRCLGRSMDFFSEVGRKVDPYGLEKPIFLVAPELSNEVVEYIENSTSVYSITFYGRLSFNKGKLSGSFMRYSLPALNSEQIKEVIEKKLARVAKRLTDEQYEGLCGCEDFADISKLNAFIEKIQSSHDRREVSSIIEKKISENNYRFVNEHVSKELSYTLDQKFPEQLRRFIEIIDDSIDITSDSRIKNIDDLQHIYELNEKSNDYRIALKHRTYDSTSVYNKESVAGICRQRMLILCIAEARNIYRNEQEFSDEKTEQLVAQWIVKIDSLICNTRSNERQYIEKVVKGLYRSDVVNAYCYLDDYLSKYYYERKCLLESIIGPSILKNVYYTIVHNYIHYIHDTRDKNGKLISTITEKTDGIVEEKNVKVTFFRSFVVVVNYAYNDVAIYNF